MSIGNELQKTPPIVDVLRTAVDFYKEKFQNATAKFAAFAPGRVNLIGEHTDYNKGFVLPMVIADLFRQPPPFTSNVWTCSQALSLVTVMVGSPNSSNDIVLHTHSTVIAEKEPASAVFPRPKITPITPGSPFWANYCKGVIQLFPAEVPGFNAVVVSSVPVGAGLSSSAALEVATYTFLEALTGKKTEDLKQKALICQKAEHDFAKVPCGIMDQYISVMGQKNHALLLDCRSLEAIQIPLNLEGKCFLITNSNVKHSLVGSEYQTRRKQCYQLAACVLKRDSLRDVDFNALCSVQYKVEDVIFKRARHVVGEIQRTTDAAFALQNNNFKKFGVLMLASHYSLKDDYEVSCPELDQLVEIALKSPGVDGSRMTGAGFGGCTVTLMDSKMVRTLVHNFRVKYKGTATCYIGKPSMGAANITGDMNKMLGASGGTAKQTAGGTSPSKDPKKAKSAKFSKGK